MIFDNKYLLFLRKAFYCCFLVCIFSPFVSAQEKITEKDYQVTQKELAVLAFFRLAGQSPDYEAWISESREYRILSKPKEMQRYLIKESLRLGRGYGMYDLSKGLLVFETSVVAHYTPPENGKPARFHFKFPDQTDDYVPVFEYPYGKDSIALIVNKFAAFSDIPLTDSQYQKVLALMPHQDEEYMAELSLQVRPSRAEIDKPLVSPEGTQWLMLSEIAYMQCKIIHPTTLKKIQLWDYVAPWYQEEYKEKNIPEEMKYPHPYDLFKDKE